MFNGFARRQQLPTIVDSSFPTRLHINVMHPYIAIPATLALVYRAWSRSSLTPAGIVVAAVTAIVHAIHPWSIFFALLVVFFLSGTAVTTVYFSNNLP